LVYLAIVAGVIAVFSWNTGVKALGPVNGVLFINLVPITAFFIGYMQHEVFTGIEIAGAALTVTALLLNNFYSRGWITITPVLRTSTA